MRLYPRSWRRTSSRKCEPRASMAALMIPWHSPRRYAGNPLRKLAPTPYGLRRFFVVRFERHPPTEPAEGTARDLSVPYVGADASSARPRCFSAAFFGSSRAVTHRKSNGLAAVAAPERRAESFPESLRSLRTFSAFSAI